MNNDKQIFVAENTLAIVGVSRKRGFGKQLFSHLKRKGYKVLAAEGAAEALRLAGETATIHLLITDLMMPEVDGLELTRRFRLVHPKTPVLMVSGSFPLIQNRADDFDRFEFLAKPFQYDELLHKVRTLLDATAPLPMRKPSRYE